MTRNATPSKENTAIMDVIARETDRFVQQDFDGWASCWVQDERTREVCVSSSIRATVLDGWDMLSDYMRGVIEGVATCKISEIQRSNVNTTVSGDIAYAYLTKRPKAKVAELKKRLKSECWKDLAGHGAFYTCH